MPLASGNIGSIVVPYLGFILWVRYSQKGTTTEPMGSNIGFRNDYSGYVTFPTVSILLF